MLSVISSSAEAIICNTNMCLYDCCYSESYREKHPRSPRKSWWETTLAAQIKNTKEKVVIVRSELLNKRGLLLESAGSVFPHSVGGANLSPHLSDSHTNALQRRQIAEARLSDLAAWLESNFTSAGDGRGMKREAAGRGAGRS